MPKFCSKYLGSCPAAPRDCAGSETLGLLPAVTVRVQGWGRWNQGLILSRNRAQHILVLIVLISTPNFGKAPFRVGSLGWLSGIRDVEVAACFGAFRNKGLGPRGQSSAAKTAGRILAACGHAACYVRLLHHCSTGCPCKGTLRRMNQDFK